MTLYNILYSITLHSIIECYIILYYIILYYIHILHIQVYLRPHVRGGAEDLGEASRRRRGTSPLPMRTIWTPSARGGFGLCRPMRRKPAIATHMRIRLVSLPMHGLLFSSFLALPNTRSGLAARRTERARQNPNKYGWRAHGHARVLPDGAESHPLQRGWVRGCASKSVGRRLGTGLFLNLGMSRMILSCKPRSVPCIAYDVLPGWPPFARLLLAEPAGRLSLPRGWWCAAWVVFSLALACAYEAHWLGSFFVAKTHTARKSRPWVSCRAMYSKSS